MAKNKDPSSRYLRELIALDLIKILSADVDFEAVRKSFTKDKSSYASQIVGTKVMGSLKAMDNEEAKKMYGNNPAFFRFAEGRVEKFSRALRHEEASGLVLKLSALSASKPKAAELKLKAARFAQFASPEKAQLMAANVIKSRPPKTIAFEAADFLIDTCDRGKKKGCMSAVLGLFNSKNTRNEEVLLKLRAYIADKVPPKKLRKMFDRYQKMVTSNGHVRYHKNELSRMAMAVLKVDPVSRKLAKSPEKWAKKMKAKLRYWDSLVKNVERYGTASDVIRAYSYLDIKYEKGGVAANKKIAMTSQGKKALSKVAKEMRRKKNRNKAQVRVLWESGKASMSVKNAVLFAFDAPPFSESIKSPLPLYVQILDDGAIKRSDNPLSLDRDFVYYNPDRRSQMNFSGKNVDSSGIKKVYSNLKGQVRTSEEKVVISKVGYLLGDDATNVARLKKAIRIFPEVDELKLLLAASYVKSKSYRKARFVLSEIRESRLEGSADNLKASMNFIEGYSEQAFATWDKLLAKDRNNYAVAMNIATAQLQLGLYRKAKSTLMKISRSYPRNKDIKNYLASQGR